MANGDERAVTTWDMTTPEGREAALLFYELQHIILDGAAKGDRFAGPAGKGL